MSSPFKTGDLVRTRAGEQCGIIGDTDVVGPEHSVRFYDGETHDYMSKWLEPVPPTRVGDRECYQHTYTTCDYCRMPIMRGDDGYWIHDELCCSKPCGKELILSHAPLFTSW